VDGFQVHSQSCEKRPLSFVTSVHPRGTTWFPLDGLSWNLIFEYILKKFVERIQVLLKSNRNNGYFTWRPIYIFYHISLCSSRMRNVSDRNCRRNRNTRCDVQWIFFSFQKLCHLWDVKKYCTARHITRQYGALHAGYLRLQMYTQNMLYLVLFHCNKGCRNVPQYCIICTLPVLLVC